MALQVHPEDEPVAKEKAIEWAVLGAEAAAELVLTAIVLPWWDDEGSS